MLNIEYIKLGDVVKARLTLAEFVKHSRESQKLSLGDIERLSRSGGRKGISRGYVSQIENGIETNPTPKMLRTLAAALGVPAKELLDRAEETKGGHEADMDVFYSEAYRELNERRKHADPEMGRFLDEYVEMVLDRVKRRHSPSRKRKGGA